MLITNNIYDVCFPLEIFFVVVIMQIINILRNMKRTIIFIKKPCKYNKSLSKSSILCLIT